jgi:hypothetical protein
MEQHASVSKREGGTLVHYLNKEYISENSGYCSTCDKYFRTGGLGCLCGASFYCNATCANKDANHYLVCSKDFHSRVRYILTLAIQKGIWINNISRPIIIIKGADGRGGCKKLLTVCTFSHVPKHIISNQNTSFGCLLCGNLTKENKYNNLIVSEGRKKVNVVMCSDCYTKKLFICKISMLPSNKCLKACVESLAKKLITLWLSIMQIMEDYVPIDIFTCFSKFMFELQEDSRRLLDLYVEKHVCTSFRM